MGDGAPTDQEEGESKGSQAGAASRPYPPAVVTQWPHPVGGFGPVWQWPGLAPGCRHQCWGEVLTFAGASFSAWTPGPAGKAAPGQCEVGGLSAPLSQCY